MKFLFMFSSSVKLCSGKMLLTIVLLGLHCLHAACFRAALHYMDHEAVVPNQYLVAFDPHMNYSLDQHWQTIGTDLSLTPDFYHFLQPPGYFSKMVQSSDSYQSVSLVQKCF